MVWGLTIYALALAVPGAAQATCTPNPVSPIVRFATTLGNIDVQLNGTDAPCTVQNFESYMDRGAYNGSIFHRSVTSPNVIQGGGYTFSSSTDKPVTIPTQTAIQNEYKDPNIADSLAMALSSEINSSTCALQDSATDEWFFNVADNSQGLDPQCFTVFGQALDPASVAVINKIAAEPVCDVDTPFGTSPGGAFADVPLIGYDTAANCTGTPAGSGDGPVVPAGAAAITASNLAFVTSMKIITDTSAPAISIASPVSKQTFNLGQKIAPKYSCNDGTGTGVKTCSGPSTVDTNLYGTIRYTVTAIDYAGNSDSRTITYLVELPPTIASVGKVSSKRALGLRLHCPSTVACIGTAALAAGKPQMLIGAGRFDLKSGRTGSVHVTLTSAGWRMFRGAKSRLKAVLGIAPSGTGAKSFKQKVTLTKAKPPPKKKPKQHKKR
jgi:cyclophilin family peptidyl-prolyl cis-trans isomerase